MSFNFEINKDQGGKKKGGHPQPPCLSRFPTPDPPLPSPSSAPPPISTSTAACAPPPSPPRLPPPPESGLPPPHRTVASVVDSLSPFSPSSPRDISI
uniref:Uncharacterized protein n=1 Tax=Oryza glumipatula TaxID=40148 RepID=A0A0E0BEW8_9ORYZ